MVVGGEPTDQARRSDSRYGSFDGMFLGRGLSGLVPLADVPRRVRTGVMHERVADMASKVCDLRRELVETFHLIES